MIKFKNVLRFNSTELQTFCNEAYHIAEIKSLQNHSIEIEVSARCKRVAGNIRVVGPNAKFVKINVSYNYYKEFGIERSIKTLRHEMAHLVAFNMTGQLDHGRVFRNVCAELGGSMSKDMAGSTHSASACNEYIRGNIKNYKYVYSCPGCSYTIERKKRMKSSVKNSHHHVCGKCRTPLVKWSEKKVLL